MDRDVDSDLVMSVVASVPATLMVATGHPWLGAATVIAVVATSLVLARLRIRAEEATGRLFAAHDATDRGADPPPPIEAVQDDEDDSPPDRHRPRRGPD